MNGFNSEFQDIYGIQRTQITGSIFLCFFLDVVSAILRYTWDGALFDVSPFEHSFSRKGDGGDLGIFVDGGRLG